MKHFYCITFVLILLVSYVQAEETLPFIELKGHTGEILFAAFSPDAKKVVTGSKDEAARIWDIETGAELLKVDNAQYLTLSPDNKKIAMQKNNTIQILDTETGKVLCELGNRPFRRVVFFPDGKKILTCNHEREQTDAKDLSAVIWDTESGKKLYELEGYTSTNFSVVFSPDGKHIATATCSKFNGDNDPTVQIWDAETGRELRRLDGSSGFATTMGADFPMLPAFSPDGKKIVTGSLILTDDDVKDMESILAITWEGSGAIIWDVESGKELQRLEGHTGTVLDGFLGTIFSVGFSPDGKKVVTSSAGSTVRIWDAESGKEIQKLEVFEFATLAVIFASFSSDGKKVLVRDFDPHPSAFDPHPWARDRVEIVRIWDAETGKELRITPPLNYVRAVSPDGRKAVTIGWNRSDNVSVIRIWDLERLLSP